MNDLLIECEVKEEKYLVCINSDAVYYLYKEPDYKECVRNRYIVRVIDLFGHYGFDSGDIISENSFIDKDEANEYFKIMVEY